MYKTLWTYLTSKYHPITSPSRDSDNGALALVDTEKSVGDLATLLYLKCFMRCGGFWWWCCCWSFMTFVAREREAANFAAVFLREQKTQHYEMPCWTCKPINNTSSSDAGWPLSGCIARCCHKAEERVGRLFHLVGHVTIILMKLLPHCSTTLNIPVITSKAGFS